MQPLWVKPGEGTAISPLGSDRSQYKARGVETGGAFALIEQTVPPGHGPRRHVHRREEEAFYILEGLFGFEVGDRSFLADAGSFVLGPRNVPHRFWNAGETPGRFLLIVSPAGLEPFFEEFSRLMADSPTNLELHAKLAAQYGIEFV